MARFSWATQDPGPDYEGQISVEDARVAMTHLLTAGMRDIDTGDNPMVRFGFRPGYGGAGQVRIVDGSTVAVDAFQVVLPTERSSTGGAYLITEDTTQTFRPYDQPAHPTYSRIDRIVVYQTDEFYGDSSSLARVLYLHGDPSADPQVPDLPGPDAIPLARLRIDPGTSAITGGKITDERPADLFTVASGGVLPVPSSAARDRLSGSGRAYNGLTVFNAETSQLEVFTFGAWLGASPTPPTVTSLAAAGQNFPVSPGQVVRFRDDLYANVSAGVWTRLTYNVGAADWAATTLTSGVVARSATTVPGTRRLGPDRIELTGQVKRTGDAAMSTGQTLCRITADHRPSRVVYFPVAASSAINAQVGIASDGYVDLYLPGSTSVSWVSLDGVIYPKTATPFTA